MYLFELILKVLSNLNLYGFNKYSISNQDLNYIYDLIIENKSNLPIIDRLKGCTYDIINFKGKPYYISGLPYIDNVYLNPYNKRTNDKFFNHLNYKVYQIPITKTKLNQVGFKSFLSFIKPYIKASNFNDYYNRLDNEFKDLELMKSLDNTFKNKKVFKISLSDIDIEKLNKKYLFFKNDLKVGQYRINFIKYDEFLKSVRIKSNYKKYQLLNDEFYNNSYSNYNYLFNSIIIVVEKLDYDDKFNFILCNQVVKIDLLKTIHLNKVNWYKSSQDKLLKDIKSRRYEFLSYDDKKDELLKKLKSLKKEFKRLDKKLDLLRKELELKEKYNRKDKLYTKQLGQFKSLNYQFNDIQDELININNELLELDKKDDEYKNNLLDYSNNLSLRLKSYLD